MELTHKENFRLRGQYQVRPDVQRFYWFFLKIKILKWLLKKIIVVGNSIWLKGKHQIGKEYHHRSATPCTPCSSNGRQLYPGTCLDNPLKWCICPWGSCRSVLPRACLINRGGRYWSCVFIGLWRAGGGRRARVPRSLLCPGRPLKGTVWASSGSVIRGIRSGSRCCARRSNSGRPMQADRSGTWFLVS